DQKHRLVPDGPDFTTLEVGNDNWPLPVPIVRQDKGWVFDSEAGREEIVNRRIGDNELSAIEVCKAIGDAQHEFALRTRGKDGLAEYAKQFASDPGQRNGLYWPTAAGEEPSPMGELVTSAAA